MIKFIENPEKIRFFSPARKMLAGEARKATGANVVINGTLFDWKTWKPVCPVRANGKTLSKDKYIFRGLAWNQGDDHFTVEVSTNMEKWDNFISCLFLVHEGKPLKLEPSPGVGGSSERTALFETQSGDLGIWADKQKLTPWQLQEKLMKAYDLQWAMMLDGGGSTQLSQDHADGVYSSRKVQNYLCFWEKPEQDNEPKGEKPMVEINAYSKAKDGDKRLTSHFKVKEMACKDGSDVVMAAPRLMMVLESIRTHFGKPIIINSGYRTPSYNGKVGGAPHSQHCYGTAADISIKGVSPQAVADYARQLMPDWGGVGVYQKQGFTHVDVREDRADWKE